MTTSFTCSDCRTPLEFATKENGGREFPVRLVHATSSKRCRRFGANPKLALIADLRYAETKKLEELSLRRDEIAQLRFRIETLEDRVDFIVPAVIESFSDPEDENFKATEEALHAAIVSIKTDANNDRQRIIALQLDVDFFEEAFARVEAELLAVRARLHRLS